MDAKTLPSEPKLPLEPTKAGSPEFTPDIEPAGPLGDSVGIETTRLIRESGKIDT